MNTWRFHSEASWVPVLYRRPKANGEYLVFRKFGNGVGKLDICEYRNGYWYSGNQRIYSVTHFRKKPEDPVDDYEFERY